MQKRTSRNGQPNPRGVLRRCLIGAALLAACGTHASSAAPAGWSPQAFATEDTLKLRTAVPTEGEYWFPVWLVVLDNQVYVRLGSRAAERVERSATFPYLGVEIRGQRFERVRGEPAPESIQQVGAAMAEKYWSDIVVRHLRHPLVLRLVPED